MKNRTWMPLVILTSFLTACGGSNSSNAPLEKLTDEALLSCFTTLPSDEVLNNLEEFNCTDTDLSSAKLTQLRALPKLKSLILINTNILNIEVLSDLKELKKLEMRNTNIDELVGSTALDISPLSTLLRLESLDLSGNYIPDLTPISNLINLTHLDLGEINLAALDGYEYAQRRVVQLPTFQNLTKLRSLNLENNFLYGGVDNYSAFIDDVGWVNLSALNTLIYLESLDLSSSIYASYMSQLPDLPNLITLDLSNNYGGPHGGNGFQIGNHLASMTKLKHLDMHSNTLNDISKLSLLTNLEYLDLSKNFVVNDIYENYPPFSVFATPIFGTIASYDPISNLSKLTYLDLSSTGGRNLGFLAGLNNLTELKLDNNYMKDSEINTFPNIEKLNTLSIKENWLTNINVLSNTLINKISVSGNCILDFTALQANEIDGTDSQLPLSECIVVE